MRFEPLTIFPGAKLPLLFAHRGYSKRAPENTLAAFLEAHQAGIPGIELDVHQCRSGELVVVHDFNLKRITGCDIEVEDADIATIRELDAGSWFDARFASQRLPLLGEVFDALGDTVYYDVEIKIPLVNPKRIAQAVTALVRTRGLTRRCMISSFNPYAVRATRKAAPEILTAVIYSNDREVPFLLRHGEGRVPSKCRVLKPEHDKVTPLGMFINKRMLGYPIVTWTVDDVERARHLIERGVAGLISNDPAPLLALC